MRILITLVLLGFSNSAFSEGKKTEICIQNLSAKDYYVWGVDQNNNEWEDVTPGSYFDPNNQWRAVRVGVNETICRRLDINVSAFGPQSWRFSFLLMDRPNSVDTVATKTGMTYRCTYTPKESDCWEDRKWMISKPNTTAPENAPGRLIGQPKPIERNERGGYYNCPDRKDPIKTCSLFKIKN
jgi:hypothetical protein